MAISTRDLPVILRGTIGTLETWLDMHSLAEGSVGVTLFSQPSFAAASHLVASADGVIHAYSAAASGLAPELEKSVEAALHLDLAAICVSGWITSPGSAQRDLAVGLAARMREIVATFVTSPGLEIVYQPVTLRPRSNVEPLRLSDIVVAYVGAAALDQWVGERTAEDYQLKLERIKTGLGLRISDLAKFVGVTREAIRRWGAGAPISEEHWGDVDRLYSVVRQLQKYFRPESLPGQVRRKIPALSGLTALELIAAGREAELLARYQRFFEGEIAQ
jgi:hypothetical protein